MSIIGIAGILCFLLSIGIGFYISKKLSLLKLKVLTQNDLAAMVESAKKLRKKCMFIIAGLLLVGAIPVVIISNVYFREVYIGIILLTMIFSVSGVIYSIRMNSIIRQSSISKDRSNK